MTEELAFMRQNLESLLTDSAKIYYPVKTDNGRGGKSEVRTLWKTLPCRVTKPNLQITESNSGLSPHTEERWDISFSATYMETNNLHILKNWEIEVRGSVYQVMTGGEEQTDAFLYHVTVERLK
jgi:hypothetical protein